MDKLGDDKLVVSAITPDERKSMRRHAANWVCRNYPANAAEELRVILDMLGLLEPELKTQPQASIRDCGPVSRRHNARLKYP